MAQREAAAFLNVTIDHVRRLFNAKIIKGREIGGDLWLYQDSLEKYKATKPHRGRKAPKHDPEPKPKYSDEWQRWYNRAKQRKSREKKRKAAAAAKRAGEATDKGKKGSR